MGAEETHQTAVSHSSQRLKDDKHAATAGEEESSQTCVSTSAISWESRRVIGRSESSSVFMVNIQASTQISVLDYLSSSCVSVGRRIILNFWYHMDHQLHPLHHQSVDPILGLRIFGGRKILILTIFDFSLLLRGPH